MSRVRIQARALCKKCGSTGRCEHLRRAARRVSGRYDRDRRVRYED